VKRVCASQGDAHASPGRPRFDNPILGPRRGVGREHVEHAIGGLFAKSFYEIVKVNVQHAAVAVEQGHGDQVFSARFLRGHRVASFIPNALMPGVEHSIQNEVD
jgi:hypothetical protein